jgi:hypothetical protein
MVIFKLSISPPLKVGLRLGGLLDFSLMYIIKS